MLTNRGIEGRVEAIAQGYTRRVQLQLEVARAQTLRARREEEAKRQAESARKKAEAEQYTQKLEARCVLARQGFARIFAASSLPSIQNIVQTMYGGSRVAECYRGLVFFDASRPSGTAWESREDAEYSEASQDVNVLFCEGYLRFEYGAFYIPDTWIWRFFHGVPMRGEKAEGDALRGNPMEGDLVTPEDLLRDIGSLRIVDMAVVANEKQRTFEWGPEDVLFQLFVNCANQRNFERYLMRCLEPLSK